MTGNLVLEKTVSCILCNGEGAPWYSGMRDRMLEVPGEWGFRRCPACGLLWLDPRPVEDDIGSAYTQDYCTHAAGEEGSRVSSLRRKMEDAAMPTISGRGGWTGRLLGALPMIRDMAGVRNMFLDGARRGGILDVGCGNGRFLAGMRRLGWETLGLEADPAAAKIARERFGLNVVEGRLGEVELHAGPFDAVTARHVVEHVHDPVSFLRRCYGLVAPGGRMAVLTPNAGSLGHRLFTGDWSELDPPRHLYMFTADTLARAAGLAGLPSPVVRSTARAARWTWGPSVSIRRTGRALGPAPAACAARFAFWAVEDALRMLAGINCGEELVLTANKPAAVSEEVDRLEDMGDVARN